MKTLQFSIFLMLFIVSVQADAQVQPKEPDYNKPLLFADLPSVMDIKRADLDNLLSLPVGTNTSTLLTPEFLVKGTVVSRSDETASGVISIVIRLVNRPGSTLCISRVRAEEGSFKFIGRILSLDNSDVLEIAGNYDKYVLQKKHLYDIVNE